MISNFPISIFIISQISAIKKMDHLPSNNEMKQNQIWSEDPMIMIYIKFESCPILMDFVYFFLLLLQVMHGLFQSFSQLGPKSKISISESPNRLFPWHYTTVSTARIGPRHYHCPKALRTHAVSANRILWVYAGFWWYHGILVVHLRDSVGAFGAKWRTKWLHHAKAPPRRGVLRWEWSNKDVHLVTTFVFCHVSKC